MCVYIYVCQTYSHRPLHSPQIGHPARLGKSFVLKLLTAPLSPHPKTHPIHARLLRGLVTPLISNICYLLRVKRHLKKNVSLES